MAYREKRDAVLHVRAYNEKAYDAIRVYVRAGEREKIRQHAQELGQTLNAYIVGLIRADMALGVIDAVTRGEDEEEE